MMRRLLCVLGMSIGLATAVSPVNTSLATLPVAYFGGLAASRGADNIAMLTRQRAIMIEKWEGPCWNECLANVTAGVPCQPSCDGEAYQLATLKRVKEANPAVATGFYQNSLYAWSFQKLTGQFGAAGQLMRSRNGSIIGLEQDNGLKHQPIFDLSQPAAVDRWLNWTRTLLDSGFVDGIFLDKPTVYSLYNRTGASWEICEGPLGPFKGHAWEECCAWISDAAASAYNDGKARLLREADALFRQRGGFITATHNGTVRYIGDSRKPSVKSLLNDVSEALSSGTMVWVAFGEVATDGNPHDTSSMCTTYDIAKAMLVLEEGVLVGCNGDDPSFSRPLGQPTGPARQEGSGVWTRTFASGTSVRLDESSGKATISWASV